jgi:hypothetical protein
MRLRRISSWQLFVGRKGHDRKNVALGTLKLAFMRYTERMHQAEMPMIYGQAPKGKGAFDGVGHEGRVSIE